MSNKSGTTGQAIPLPPGGGALHGIGETFSPDLFTGTGNLTVPLALPPGRNGFQPQLSLVYSTGAGNGPFGLGWDVPVPGVCRKTAQGVPRYRDMAADPADRDTFILSGAEDLVAVAEPDAGVTRFRPRTEGLFARIEHVREAGQSVWRVSAKDGLSNLYGARLNAQDDPAVVADPADRSKIFSWRLSQTTDPFGNRIEYGYLRDSGSDGPHTWDQVYLQQVRYADYTDEDGLRFLVSVDFVYEPRDDDPFSDYRPGFEVRTRLRCKRIEVRTHPRDEDLLTRSYELVYVDERVRAGELPAETLPLNRVSLLSQVRVVGHDGDRRDELPPLDFEYTRFAPEQQRFQPFEAVDELPPRSLADDDFEMVDLFANGLPDIVRLNGGLEFWRNLGGGLFDRPQPMDEVPAGVRLGEAGVQLADMNGDGRADLLTLPDGYHPLTFQGRWGPRVPYAEAPQVQFGQRDIRLVDLDGDGVVDALRTAQRFELFFNDPREGWQPVETRERRPLAEFPDLSFEDDRVKLADVSGDGLQDFVSVRQGRVDYWPYLGHGSWGRRVTMANSPTFDDTIDPGGEFDPARVMFGDLDGDGLDDIAYVGDDRVSFCINQGGGGWSDPITVTGTPPFTNIDGVRLADMLGNGMAGVLWTFDRLPGDESSLRFLDPTGGAKPYLLERIDNHMGAVTRVHYAPSTTFYLADREPGGTPWKTPLAFPVQVIERIEVVDEISGGRLSSELRYHHGYWDGAEREFRGFGMVEQRDTETFERGEDSGRLSPPALTKTWFHLGPTGDEGGRRVELDLAEEYWSGDPPLLGRAAELDALLDSLPASRHGDVLRALRGSVLRTEVFGLDGTERAGRPFSVAETQFSVRAEEVTRAFFPHTLAERLTQWERGDDPMTRITFARGHDAAGQPRERVEIGCPRGWRRMDDRPAAPYLATRTETVFAEPVDPRVHIADRVARTTVSELADDVGLTVAEMLQLPAGAVIEQTLSFYDGAAFAGRAFAEVGAHGAVTRSERFVLTERAFAGEEPPPYLVPGAAPGAEYPAAFLDALAPLAGHSFHDGDDEHERGWFATELRHRYDIHDGGSGRGLLRATRDSMGGETTLEHGFFDLLPTAVTDPNGVSTTAEYDRRVLQPSQAADPNGNRSRFAYTPQGLLASIAVTGEEDGEPVGDTANAPSTRFDYDFRAFQNSPPGDRRPVSVRTTRRTQHARGSSSAAAGTTIETAEYSDGFGRLLQRRVHAEDALFGDPAFGGSVVPADQSAPAGAAVGRRRGSDEPPNVLVTGRQTYDNKGRIVEMFEPFFAAGFGFARAPEAAGAKATLAYDAVGRLVRRLNPDASVRSVIMGVPGTIAEPDLADPDRFEPTPWEIYTYEESDNGGRAPGAAGASPEAHHDTPGSVELDALGRVIASTDRNGRNPDRDWFVTRFEHDVRGNLLAVRDPLGHLAAAYRYDLANRPLRIDGGDGGARRRVLDAAGNEVERRDGKGALVLRAHDAGNRPIRLWARDSADGPVTLRERLVYGDSPESGLGAAEAAAAHLRGELHRHHDEAGRLTFERYDFKGNATEKVREVFSDATIAAERFQVDWEPPQGTSLEAHAAALLDPREYRVSTRYDALDRVVGVGYPQLGEQARSQLELAYNQAGALERASLDGEPVVAHMAYDAKGQRTLVARGNGVMTRYAHDPATFRVVRLRSERFSQPDPGLPVFEPSGVPPLQDVAFRYDLAGNMTAARDRVPGCGVPGSPLGPDQLERTFAYDPLNRLVEATGRECDLPPERPWEAAPRCADLTRARVYRERYQYDAAGNLRELRHRANGAGFRRRFELEQASNRLATLTVGQSVLAYEYDAAGNVVAETSSRLLDWDHADRLARFRTQAGDSAPSIEVRYLYDAEGQRVKKLVRRQGGALESRVYVDELFEHHRWQQAAAAGENALLHVVDDEDRLAAIRIGTPHPDDAGPAVQHHLADHQGNGNVVVDGEGRLVDREEYTPYGESSFGSFARKRFRFLGKEREEESGHARCGVRCYAPWLGRWASPDPAALTPFTCEGAPAAAASGEAPPGEVPEKQGAAGERTASLAAARHVEPTGNPYSYGRSNPLRFVDKDGRQPTVSGSEAHRDILPVLAGRINTLPEYSARINVRDMLPGSSAKPGSWAGGEADLVIFATGGGEHVYDLKPVGSSGQGRYAKRQIPNYVHKLRSQFAARVGTVLERMSRYYPDVLDPIEIQKGDKLVIYTLSLPFDHKTGKVVPGFIEYQAVTLPLLDPEKVYAYAEELVPKTSVSSERSPVREHGESRARTGLKAAAAVGAGYVAWKIGKGAIGFVIGGPIGAAIGLATP